MSDYAIGDIQGCFDSLKALLKQCDFDPGVDRLWLVGDLVNRGPKSLKVLRWARGLEDSVIAVLGNHDLHLLEKAAGARCTKKRDSLDAILEATESEELLTWLRNRPLVYREGKLAMVHAGLLPAWSAKKARKLSREVTSALAGDDWQEFMHELAGFNPPAWDDELEGNERLASIVAVLTRIRVCTKEGALCDDFAGPPAETPKGFKPWFDFSSRASNDSTILFGHWAALGFYVDDNVICLDSGCVWGQHLTALRLEDRKVFKQAAID